MTKTIVTHQHPDLDAIMSVWLLIRQDQSRYGDAKIEFVPGSTTYKGEPVDSDPDVVHVDVGFGRYDHHQEGVYGTCASEIIYHSLIEEGLVSPSDKALKAMIEYAVSIDNFLDREWEEGRLARYGFTLSEIIPALHRLQVHDNEAVLRMVMVQLDGVYQRMKDYYKAKEELTKGEEFVSRWGRGIMVVSGADNIHKIAQREGYEITVVSNPDTGYMGIKIAPNSREKLKVVYDRIVELDGADKWFYHNSGQMLLFGSSKGKKPKASRLNIKQILEIIKEFPPVADSPKAKI